jgi:toxin ParE1/3/4
LRVRYFPLARKDILAIKTWTARSFGPIQAAVYVRQMKTAMLLISENPGLARDASDLRPGLLKTLAGSHMMYFHIKDGNIDVLRVLHGKMEPERWM